jgi:colanic acid/amylovoran biosynthesis protein
MLGRAAIRGGLRLSQARRPVTLWPDLSAGPMLDAAGAFDALVDISGFSYGDAWGTGLAYSALPAVRRAVGLSAPIVFMPQAWGAFDRPRVRRAVLALTRGPDTLVYSRDALSTRHLEAAGLPAGSVATKSDIVFAFEGGTDERGRALLRAMGCAPGRPVICVAPNMRAYERSAGPGAGNGYVRSLVALVRHCVDHHEAEVVLLPFECAPVDRGTDDRRLCAIVREGAQRDASCHTSAGYVTANDAWAMIRGCEYVVGSRFHSLVFALSQGVPCTALGWSHKYGELMALFDCAGDCASHGALDERRTIDLFEDGWRGRVARRAANLKVSAALRQDTVALFDEVAAFLHDPHARA